MKHFEEVTYYESLETENGEVYGCGDYWGIKIFDKETNTLIEEFGDSYHDKGYHKLEGFYRGIKYAGIDFIVTKRVEKADF